MRTSLRIICLFLLLISVGKIFSQPITELSSEIAWQPYSDSIFVQAKQKNQLILLYGRFTECPWCKKMNTSYRYSAVVELVTKHFVPVILDVDKNSVIAKQYLIVDVPIAIILDANNQWVDSFPGFLTHEGLFQKLQSIVSRYQVKQLHEQSRRSASTTTADNKQPFKIVIVGDKKDPQANKLYQAALPYVAHNASVVWLDKSEGPLNDEEISFPRLKKPAAYICANRICSIPVLNPDKLSETVSRLTALRKQHLNLMQLNQQLIHSSKANQKPPQNSC